MMESKQYRISKTKKEKEAVNLEIDKLDGFKVKPKVKNKSSIKVDEVLLVDSEFSEKIIRKKVDIKIAYLLEQLKLLQDNDGTNHGTINKSLMQAEKLRIQLINKYVKYLGNTYYSLTLKKIELIIDELNYKLYMEEFYKEQLHYYDNSQDKQGRKGR